MKLLEVIGAVRPLYGTLDVKGLIFKFLDSKLEDTIFFAERQQAFPDSTLPSDST